MRMRVLTVGSLTGLTGFTVLLAAVAAGWSPLLAADRELARDANRWMAAEPWLVEPVQVLSDWVWDPVALRLAALALLAALLLRRRPGSARLAVWAAAVLAAGMVLAQVVKWLVRRARPRVPEPVDHAPGFSFPSGHATTGVVGSGVLAVLLLTVLTGVAVRRLVLLLALLSAVGVGLTRVLLGVHFAADVLAGWLLGTALLAAGVLLGAKYGALREDWLPGETRSL